MTDASRELHLFDWLAQRLPGVDASLRAARIDKSPKEYLRESFIAASIVSGAVLLLLLILAFLFEFPLVIVFFVFIILFAFLSYSFVGRAQYSVLQAEKLVESEMVSVVRFLILELKGEQSLYDALKNASSHFPMVGIYLDEIVDKVKMGKTLEQAILDAVETCPSAHLRALYWQLLNSLQTGADITTALRVQLDDIVENQKILIEEYGRELNALSLFYMMLSIIIPTVGFTIVTAVLTFIGAPITLWMLIVIWAFLTVIQYFFLMITARRRPSVEAH